MQKRNTAQKKAIFAELSSRKDHPSATRLYEDLKDRVPGLSKATVYRVLKNAAEEGEILRLHVGTEDRFDGDLNPHLHVVCSTCEDVFDATVPPGIFAPLEKESGYALLHAEFYGLCPKCREKNAL